MRVHIFSDLHIRGSGDPLFTALLKTLENIRETGDAVVFAGDLFDLFIGNDPALQSEYPAFLGVLRNLESHGVQIHYLEGNHDFNFSPFFAGLSISIADEPLVLQHGSKRLWIEHGDQVDQSDTGYKMWRTFTRSPVGEALSRTVPFKFWKIATRGLARDDEQRAKDLPEHWSPGSLHSMRWMYRHHAEKIFHEGMDWVVMGHCHDFDEYSVTVDGRQCQYFNMGYPRVHKHYVMANMDSGNIQRVEFF